MLQQLLPWEQPQGHHTPAVQWLQKRAQQLHNIGNTTEGTNQYPQRVLQQLVDIQQSTGHTEQGVPPHVHVLQGADVQGHTVGTGRTAEGGQGAGGGDVAALGTASCGQGALDRAVLVVAAGPVLVGTGWKHFRVGKSNPFPVHNSPS